jgi:hypothetical protein
MNSNSLRALFSESHFLLGVFSLGDYLLDLKGLECAAEDNALVILSNKDESIEEKIAASFDTATKLGAEVGIFVKTGDKLVFLEKANIFTPTSSNYVNKTIGDDTEIVLSVLDKLQYYQFDPESYALIRSPNQEPRLVTTIILMYDADLEIEEIAETFTKESDSTAQERMELLVKYAEPNQFYRIATLNS